MVAVLAVLIIAWVAVGSCSTAARLTQGCRPRFQVCRSSALLAQRQGEGYKVGKSRKSANCYEPH
jgi:hypothetical protein